MRRFLLLMLMMLTGCMHTPAQVTISGGVTLSNGVSVIPGGVCVITTTSLPSGTTGVFYDQTLQTANCVAPLSFSASSGFPGWATLNPSTGRISGTPFAGSFSFTITLRDGAGNSSFFTPAFNIASSGAGAPLAPDAALTAWDFSQAGTPTGTTTLCVGTPVNAAALPGGSCASSFAGSTAGFQAALNAVACGQIVNVAAAAAGATIPYGAQQLPNNIICTPSTYVWITGDLSDTSVPADGTRVDPCQIGIPQTAMPYYPYPTADSTPNTCARHLPQIIVAATSNNPCFRFSVPGGTNTPSIAYWRIQRFECTRDESADAVTALVALDYQPNAAGQDCAIVNSLPANAVACAADQPNHLVISQNVIHGHPQRQTVRAISMGGGTFIAVVDNYIYDILDTYAGGQGDAQAIAGGFGRGYTGVGNWIFQNNFTASSSEGQIFCGAFVEPTSPATGKSGIPDSVIWNHDWFYKPRIWDTQRGQAQNLPETNEGITYPPVPDQEQVWQGNFQVRQGGTFSLYNTWLYDSAGGWNRINDNGTPPALTITIDGVPYTTVTSANGIITKSFLTIGSNPWQITNVVQWLYTACAGAGNPIAACTGATTPGAHTLVFNGLVLNGLDGSLGNDRHLITTITATVTAGTPTNFVSITPSTPDLQIQPSYSDSFNNKRNFAYVFTGVLNFATATMTWKVDGVTNGNATVGRICAFTAIPCTTPDTNDLRVVYVSGTGLGLHTISLAAFDGTTTTTATQPITVSTTAPVWGYDLKAITVKNMWEAKCLSRGVLEFSILENTWGSNGNGGGQNTCLLNQPANNANQTKDGNGVTVGYGPMKISDLFVDHIHIIHAGGGFSIAGLSGGLGIHRLTYSNILMEDLNGTAYSHGFVKPIFTNFLQFSGAGGTTVVPWTSASNPLTDNIFFTHITSVGGTASSFGINSWLSIANNNAQFQLGPFSITDSIFESPGATPFYNSNGEANDCGTNTSGSKSESVAFLGTGYIPPTPCFSTYSLARNLLVDNTTPTSKFVTPTIWQASSTDTDLFVNYNGGNGGNYHVKAGQYAAGGLKDALDGSALGADIDGIAASDIIVRRGSP
jgi:hypothetical protein